MGNCIVALPSQNWSGGALESMVRSRLAARLEAPHFRPDSTLSSYEPRKELPHHLEHIVADLLFNSRPGPLRQPLLVIP